MQLHSARCNIPVLDKYYETLKRLEKPKTSSSEFNKHSLWHLIREDESIKKRKEKKLHLHANEEGDEEICAHNHSDDDTPVLSEVNFAKEDAATDQRILSQNSSRLVTLA